MFFFFLRTSSCARINYEFIYSLSIVDSETFHVLLEIRAWRILSRPPSWCARNGVMMTATQRFFSLPNPSKEVFTSISVYRTCNLQLIFKTSILRKSKDNPMGHLPLKVRAGLRILQLERQLDTLVTVLRYSFRLRILTFLGYLTKWGKAIPLMK